MYLGKISVLQSCKLNNSSYMIAWTQITNTEIFAFIAALDYVHTLQIGFVPKYFCIVRDCLHNLRNVPELIVHMWSEQKRKQSINKLQTGKTNSNNVKDTQNVRKNYDFNWTEKKKLLENFYFFCFILLTICGKYSEIDSLHFFEWSGIVLICFADSIIA